MMTGRIVVPLVPKVIWRRYCYNHLAAFTGNKPRTTPAYTWTCWQCGKDGVLGVDLFFGPLPRLRNLMHHACWEAIPVKVRNEMEAKDFVIRMRLSERRRALYLLHGKHEQHFGMRD